VIIIDVREPTEYKTGHVEGALNIPPSELMGGSSQLDNIAKDEQIVLYCLSGSRSNVSMQLLQTQGYTNLTNGINKDHVARTYGLKLV
jgi:phage shock protein E